MGRHTVEKIGGTSMSQFGEIMQNVILHGRQGAELYNRIFVVSAYGGITNLLLEHKKTGESGVYQYYADHDSTWHQALTDVATAMCEINAGFADIGLDVASADAFVHERVEGIRACLKDLRRLCSYGHFSLNEHLPAVREMLSAVGEAHSAHNSVSILQNNGVNAVFVDLTGWMEEANLPFDDKITGAFSGFEFDSCLPIVTGYTKCSEGIMSTFDRGYSEITFSKVAVLTDAREGVIHKEFHLCTGDPNLIGEDNVKVIGYTNYDVADQLADLGMEAIHPRAAKGMEFKEIPLRVKNAFDPDHPGTLITTKYASENFRVEMVTGRENMLAIEVMDPDMVGQYGYDHHLLKHFADHKISYVAKNTNANTITHYVPADCSQIDVCIEAIQDQFPTAEIRTLPVSIVSAIGSNMSAPGFLAKAADALAGAGINILAVNQCMRQVNMQFVVREEDFDNAICALHRGVVERYEP